MGRRHRSTISENRFRDAGLSIASSHPEPKLAARHDEALSTRLEGDADSGAEESRHLRAMNRLGLLLASGEDRTERAASVNDQVDRTED